MFKAFSHRHPIRISDSDRTLIKNPNSLTKNYNVLLIENPIGSGFSVAERPIRNYDQENQATEAIFEFLLEKHPNWLEANWIFYGESYCGISIPITVDYLLQVFKLKIKGVMIYSPWMSVSLQSNSMDYWKVYNRYQIWDNWYDKY